MAGTVETGIIEAPTLVEEAKGRDPKVGDIKSRVASVEVASVPAASVPAASVPAASVPAPSVVVA